MSDFKTEYPVLYFNEYFRRKPMRLNERESEELFTLEQTDVNNFEYISLHDHEKEIASLKEQLKREQDCVDFYADKDNWVDMEMIGYSSSIRNDEQCGNEFGESEYLSIGGKLARSAQARREK